jgi:hypothetical protein
MRDHVVQLTRDPGALGGGGDRRLLVALGRQHPRPLLKALALPATGVRAVAERRGERELGGQDEP